MSTVTLHPCCKHCLHLGIPREHEDPCPTCHNTNANDVVTLVGKAIRRVGERHGLTQPFADNPGNAESPHDHAPGLWCDECPDAEEKRAKR